MRTSRTPPSILDGIIVTAYGQPTPLNQAVNLTAPEGRLLQITPFDPSKYTGSSHHEVLDDVDKPKKARSDGKPENMLGQIVDGMLKKHIAERC